MRTGGRCRVWQSNTGCSLVCTSLCPSSAVYWLSGQYSLICLCCYMTMRDEAPEAFAAGFTDETPDARGWIPEPPDDDGWFLGSVHDTSYGPACYWFRNTTTA
ncbi:hypothetical protein H5325_004389 [Escherichia coli]|nr:hypothetical protein [Escherichia coli]